jgi:flagellum-specific ATP synthase
LIDSITRFAEAHREVALAAGENAAMRGFPASTPSAIAALCERAGPGEAEQGDITAVYSVLVSGSDMEEPVADMLRGVLDGHVVLDREIAERGRFPAVDVLRSVSRSLPKAATPAENQLIAEARSVLAGFDRVRLMVQAGLYSSGADPAIDRAIKLCPKLEQLMSDKEAEGIAVSFARLSKILHNRAEPDTADPSQER